MTVFKTSRRLNPGDKRPTKGEEILEDIQFNVHKFNSKERPNKKNTIVICCFSEFGCEVMGAMYNVPRIIRENKGKHVIVVGWYGRAYLYKHLADEFWEMKEQHQWLREYCLAFHHESKNLTRAERSLQRYGQVFTSEYLGRLAVGNNCLHCHNFWGQVEEVEKCPQCGSKQLQKGLFADVDAWRSKLVSIPDPSIDKMQDAARRLGPKPVAVTARNRKAYGRNLPPEFYVKLIQLLKSKDYTPIWVGEKQSTLACPDPEIVDLTRMSEGSDLEYTLAVVKQCVFTVQFWTASTRLAGIMGVPYLIFESPDQVFGNGQESYRMGLCTLGKRKLALCHYLKVLNDQDNAIQLVGKCIEEMEAGDWDDVIGMVDEPEIVEGMRTQNMCRFGKETNG
jgi:hypothetical protein